MSACFLFEKGAAKKTQLFVIASPIDMNVNVFWETSMGFLKSVVLQLFPRYSQSDVKVGQNSIAFKK